MAKANLSLEDIKQILRSHIYANEYDHIRIKWHSSKKGTLQLFFINSQWSKKKWTFARRYDAIQLAHKELWKELKNLGYALSFSLLSPEQFNEASAKGIKIFES